MNLKSPRIQQFITRVGGEILRIVFFWKDRHHLYPFGFGSLTLLLGKYFFHPDNRSEIFIGPSGRRRFQFYLNDYYWSVLLLPRTNYEPEVACLLDRVLEPGTVFIDCGANIGYWSIYARDTLQADDVLAVEPVQDTYDQLLQNAELNGGFRCVRAAIADRDNSYVQLTGNSSASMSIVDVDVPSYENKASCCTTTLDALYNSYLDLDDDRIVIKLDVEGAELSALKAASTVLEAKPLLIYEELTKFAECEISDFLVNELEYKVYQWTPSKKIHEVSLTEIKAIVSDGKVHNFMAHACDAIFWNSKLAE